MIERKHLKSVAMTLISDRIPARLVLYFLSLSSFIFSDLILTEMYLMDLEKVKSFNSSSSGVQNSQIH